MPGNGYAAVFKASFKEFMAYRASLVLTIIFMIVYPLILIFVWKSVYLNTGVLDIAGITLKQMYLYFFFDSVAFLVSESYIVWWMRDAVKDGSIACDLARPLPYPRYVFVASSVQPFFNIVFAAIPITLIIVLFAGIQFSLLTALLFAIALFLDYAIVNLYSFIFGTLTIYFTDVSGLYNAFFGLALLFGGGVMPIILFPAAVQPILLALPFQFLAFVPSAIATGIISVSTFIRLAEIGVAWVIALFIIAWVLWSKTKIKMNVVGI